MKMDDMNAYFESKGFEVKREYHKTEDRKFGDPDGYYTFIISKNNNHQFGKYHWPHNQQSFMDKMIADFEKAFPSPPWMDDKAITSALNIPHSVYLSSRPAFRDDRYASLAIAHDVMNTFDLWAKRSPFISMSGGLNVKIKNVIFNDPATIVFWSDGSKTVVKCQDDDIFDPEKGLAMAISKKALGNKGNYCNELKKWLPKEEPLDPVCDGLVRGMLYDIKIPDASKIKEALNKVYGFQAMLKANERSKSIQKAYDILVKGREDHGFKNGVLDEAIGYLGEALED